MGVAAHRHCPICGEVCGDSLSVLSRCTVTASGDGSEITNCVNDSQPLRLTEAAAVTKTEDGQDFTASSYAYVPDGTKSSGWKLRLEEKPGEGPTAKQVGMALAALSPGGFRGKKVAVPAAALPAVKRRIFAAWKKVHPDDTDVPAELKASEAVGDRTFDDIRDMVSEAIIDTLPVDSDGMAPCVWVQDLTDSWAVYRAPDGDLVQVTYSLGDDGAVTLGPGKPVQRVTSYEPEPDDDEGETGDSSSTESRRSDRIHGRILGAKGTDSNGGRVYSVQIIAYGDSKNGRRYPESVMRAAASKYNGAKAYDHHRTDEELATSTIQGLIGSYQNVTASSEGLQADLHLLPSATHAAEALDASLTAQSNGGAPLVGISHDVMANYRPLVEGGKRMMEATEILSVNSSDVVADPAAGGKATRMVAGGSGGLDQGEEMDLKQLLELLRGATSEKRAELLTEHKDLVVGWGLDDAAVSRILDKPAGDSTSTGGDTPAAGTGTGTDVTVGAGAATEAVIGRSSLHGRMLIREAAAAIGLDGRFVETITKRLPESFTEGQLTAELTRYSEMRVELEREQLGREGGLPHVQVTKDERTKQIEMLDHMLDRNYRGAEAFRSLKQAFVAITGRNPYAMPFDGEDFNRLILRESIGAQLFDSAVRSRESVSAGTWNVILGDSITRRMVAEYTQPSLSTWRSVVSSVVPINDFRTQRIERLGGYGVLPAVGEGAPYQALTTPGNEEATYTIAKKGGIEDLTIETIANDDLRAVQRVPTKLGLAAAQTIFRYVWDLFIANPTYTPDSTAVFASGHNNTATSALSRTALASARKAMRKQSAYGDTSDVLSIVPKMLITVPDLEELAFQLCTSAVALPTAAPDGAAANQPNLHQGLDLTILDYWSASSTTAWFIVGDPNMTPTIEMGFYQGRQDPELFVQNDPTVGSVFTADKVTYKIRHIYAGTWLDFRAAYRGNA